MTRSTPLLLALLAAVTLAACDGPATDPASTAAPAPATDQTTDPSYPVPDATASLPGPDEPLTLDTFPAIDGSTAAVPLIKATTERLTGETLDYEIGVSQTSYAWTSVVEPWWMTDWGLLFVYPPDETTRAAVAASGVPLDIAPIGRDALVFVTNADNPVSNLSADQIRAVYSGQVTSWSELGGADEPIAAYQRNEDSGSQALMRSLVMGATSMIPSPAGLVAGGMLGLILELETYDNTANALGYSVYYYVSEMEARPGLKILSVDGVAPTQETIADGTYPFTTDFYAVIRSQAAAGSPARRVFEWIQSDEGRETVAASGYVTVPAGAPLTLDLFRPGPSTPGCPDGIVLPVGVDAADVCPGYWAENVVEATAWADDYTVQIASPSGNIVCQLTPGWPAVHGTALQPNITCAIRAADYIDQDLDDEAQVQLTVTGEQPGAFTTTYSYYDYLGTYIDWDAAPSQTAEYGQVTGLNELVCRSSEEGMTCWNQNTSHGFFVSRAAFATW